MVDLVQITHVFNGDAAAADEVNAAQLDTQLANLAQGLNAEIVARQKTLRDSGGLANQSVGYAALKPEVITSLSGLTFGQDVAVVSQTNITLSGLQTIDGYTTLAGDRVLVVGQTAQAQNGIYVAASGAWALAYDSVLALSTSQAWSVLNGNSGGGTTWRPYVAGTPGSTVNTWIAIQGFAALLPVSRGGTGANSAAQALINLGVTFRSVATLAALRLVTVPSASNYVYATGGYYSTGDAGAGIYIWNASDVRADNGGTIIQITGNPTGRFNLVSNVYNICQFGAHGDGVTDDLSFINTAITAANAAGGGIVEVPALTFVHSAAITMKPLVIIRGAGKTSSTFKSNHVGDGITMLSPINSTTSVHTLVRDLQIWNTNAANTGGGYDDVGGTFVYLENVRIRGFNYGVIFDQTELGDVNLCDFETQLSGGVWLVNGSEHTPSASPLFTNRIGITRCQFNNNAVGWAIIDEGGYAHSFRDNNFNGFVSHIRICGTQNLDIATSEFESASSVIMVFSNTALVGGAAKGQPVNTVIHNNTLIPTSGNFIATIFSGSPITFSDNYFGNTTAIKINGAGNANTLILTNNVNGGGGATVTAGAYATRHLQYDTNGLLIAGTAFGTPILSHGSATGALSFGAPGAVPGAVDLTLTVTGAAIGDTVAFAPGAAIPANYSVSAWVDSANTVKVRLLQFAGAATAQNLGTCRADVWKH